MRAAGGAIDVQNIFVMAREVCLAHVLPHGSLVSNQAPACSRRLTATTQFSGILPGAHGTRCSSCSLRTGATAGARLLYNLNIMGKSSSRCVRERELNRPIALPFRLEIEPMAACTRHRAGFSALCHQHAQAQQVSGAVHALLRPPPLACHTGIEWWTTVTTEGLRKLAQE